MKHVGRFVLGVDGGGSSTIAWVADEAGVVLGRGAAGPSNVKAVGEIVGLGALESAVWAALASASVARVDVACLGLAGFDRDADRASLARWAEGHPFADRLVLVNDGELVLAAGTAQGWGVAVIAGTGSICVGRAADGRSARAGGWGPIFGDEGSGYATAVSALRLAAGRFDGRAEGDWQGDPLSQALCRAVGVSDPSGLVTAIYGPGFDRARVASLAAVVVEVAQLDPVIERDLLYPAGTELARAASAVASRLSLPKNGLPLALAGGFLLSAEPVRQALIQTLEGDGFRVTHAEVKEPVSGAILLARRALRGETR